MTTKNAIQQTALQYLPAVTDYKLINELQTRIVADIVGHENGRGCLSAEYIAKLNALNDAINAVKVHW
jgi:hypothetical protein